MGNFIDICGKKEISENEKKIDMLNKQNEEISRKLNKIIDENNKLIGIRDRLFNELENISKEYKIIEGKKNQYESVFKNKEILVESILDSNLNCEWMDDEKEKLYLKSIIQFIDLKCKKVKK